MTCHSADDLSTLLTHIMQTFGDKLYNNVEFSRIICMHSDTGLTFLTHCIVIDKFSCVCVCVCV